VEEAWGVANVVNGGAVPHSDGVKFHVVKKSTGGRWK
jgi:hypothetical protein